MMRAYILADLEGATGVVDFDYGGMERRKKDRLHLVNDVNAAVEGAYEAGVRDIVVFDGHGKDAVQLDKLDTRATLIKRGKVVSYLPGLDMSFTHFLLVGFHSMAGSGGLLNHTHSLRVKRIVINGREIGEIGMAFIYAHYFQVKPVFISGDDKAVAEAMSYISEIEGVVVKKGISERCGECLPPERTRLLIRDGAHNALSKNKISSFCPPSSPYDMTVVYKKPWVALPRYLLKGRFSGVNLKGLFSITYRDSDFARLMQKFIGSYGSE